MAFFRVSIRRESYIDIFVEVPDGTLKHDVHYRVKKNLDTILKETPSGWADEPKGVHGVFSCPEDEAKLHPITKLE